MEFREKATMINLKHYIDMNIYSESNTDNFLDDLIECIVDNDDFYRTLYIQVECTAVNTDVTWAVRLSTPSKEYLSGSCKTQYEAILNIFNEWYKDKGF